MYLSGSGPHLRRGRRRTHPWRVVLLLVLIGSVAYFYKYVIPSVPPPFLPTPTVTRSPVSYAEEAEAMFAAGKLKDAVAVYRKAIEMEPSNLDYYVATARIQVFMGDYEAGLVSAENAVLLDPNSPRAHAVRSWALAFYPDRQEAAFAAAVQALQLDANYALAHAYFAEILADQGKWEDAAHEARRALELAPSLVESHRAMAYVFEYTGNYDEAIEEYKRAIAIHGNLAMLYKALGKNFAFKDPPEVETAIENYQKAIALDPEDAQTYSLTAQAYASVGEYGKASQYVEQAVELVPTEARYRGQLGLMYYHNNEYAPAIRELFLATQGGAAQDAAGNAVAVQPLQLDYGRVAEYYYTLGLALAQTSRCDQAMPIFDSVLATVPDDEIATFNAAEGQRMCREAAYATEAAATQAATPSP